ncbi:MAG: Gfo/Idh/MocA family oxidoreductase [Candidatus Poribacteria bacterium]|nr:Gfo/Idh/MocA family oxidoreductase [Candidatus Poribacteria bacterium]
MSDKKRCLMIGAGGMAGGWIRHFFPPFSNRMEVVGLVEIREDVLKDQGDFLNLNDNQRFTRMEDAFSQVDADFCTIVIPPAYHRQAAVGAAEAGLDILSEKPIADSWEDCLAIYEAVKKAGVKMQVTQNYRFTPRIQTLKQAADKGLVGTPYYLMARFAADYRNRNAWGKFRHEIDHSLLVEGSVHHFDQLRHLTGADCATIAGWEWNPGHASFDGECIGTYVMTMTNNLRAHYEGNCLESGAQNSWHAEYYRIVGSEGALVLDSDHKVRLLKHVPREGVSTEELPTVGVTYDGHQAIVDQFLSWLEGGDEPPTVLDDNIKSAAMLFGAIDASERNEAVDVVAKLKSAIG